MIVTKNKNDNKKDRERILQIIRGCGMFEGIDLEGLHPVYMEFGRGSEISDVIDGKTYVGIIGSGEADVYTVTDELSQPNVSTQKRGSIFGICNVYIERTMPTRLICKVGCEVVLIPKEEFKNLVLCNRVFQERYLALCNEKIFYLAGKIELLGIYSSKARIAHYLLKRADSDNVVVLDTSKEQLAKYLSISRASLFRGLADFTGQGIIETDGDRVIIRKPEALLKIKND